MASIWAFIADVYVAISFITTFFFSSLELCSLARLSFSLDEAAEILSVRYYLKFSFQATKRVASVHVLVHF